MCSIAAFKKQFSALFLICLSRAAWLVFELGHFQYNVYKFKK